MFGTSGIRGTIGEQVTAKTALDVGRALATHDTHSVVVGRDPRESGAALADAMSAGLRECGVDAIRLGVVPTPTIARSVGWLDADAGVAITGSHNPPSDNGIKLWTPSGRAFNREQRRQITRRINGEAFNFAAWDGHGEERTWDDASEYHRNRLVSAHDVIDDLTVVVDIGNGAGQVTADALDSMGCAVQTLNAQPDGSFPGRESEPTAESCRVLAQTVERTDADLGIAHDGDADRMMAVTTDGEFLSGDRLLALFGREYISPGKEVAVPVDTSLLVDDIIRDAGGTVRRTKVGDVFVAEAADDPDVVFGGEPSGAWIWPDETLCPDGPFAACRLASLIDRREGFDSVLADIDTYPIRRKTVSVGDKLEAMDRVREQANARYEDVGHTDGVRVSTDDGWFLVRASGTEPLLRITAESRSPERATTLLEEAESLAKAAADLKEVNERL